ncbi:hypothetical protein MEX01_49590 [Methylorubrum extorquens]|nr:hypothetical protein MEX01_49590 [Methylorubrum extorquens]
MQASIRDNPARTVEKHHGSVHNRDRSNLCVAPDPEHGEARLAERFSPPLRCTAIPSVETMGNRGASECGWRQNLAGRGQFRCAARTNYGRARRFARRTGTKKPGLSGRAESSIILSGAP